MLNKKAIYIVLILLVYGCSNPQKYIMNNTCIYHVAALDTIYTTGIVSPFNPYTIRYVGKIEIDKEKNSIRYSFLKTEDEKRLSSIFNIYKNGNQKLQYAEYSKKKLTKFTNEETIDYIQSMHLWRRTGSISFSNPNFWNIFKKYGITTTSSRQSGITYRVIDYKIGEELYKNNNEALGTELLRKAIKLNKSEYFSGRIKAPIKATTDGTKIEENTLIEESPLDLAITLNTSTDNPEIK